MATVRFPGRLAPWLLPVLFCLGLVRADFSPDELPDLILWLDAGVGASVVRVEGVARVVEWRDRSPAGHRATPVHGLAPPVHVPDQLNGRGVLRFDGTHALVLEDSAALDFQGGDDLALFAVANARSNGSLLARTDGAAMQYRFHVPRERTLRVVFGRGGEQRDSVSTLSPDTFRLLSVAVGDRDGERRFALRIDGRDEGGGIPGTGQVQSATTIGGRDGGAAQRLNFDLAELILYRRALTEDERDRVEAYLRAKYALAEQQQPVLPEPLAEAPEGTFSLVVVPDTQRFHGPGSGRGDEDGEPRNPAFASRIDWIVRNLDTQRIVFVSHVGDIVDRNNHSQWGVARALMDRLHDLVPYGISVGNHDMTGRGDSSLFQEYFGAGRFADFPWYGGTYEGHPERGPAVSGNNANSWQAFSAGGFDFVIVHVECNAPDDVLAWVDSVLAAQRHRMAIVTTHMYLGGIERRGRDEPQGRMVWKKVHGERGNTPQQMWEKSFAKHPNLFLVLCGDQSVSISHRQTSRGEHGNLVHEVLQDYPRSSDDSDWLRIFRFHPDERRIRAFTYSPAQDRLADRVGHLADPGDHQFELDIAGTVDDHLRQRQR